MIPSRDVEVEITYLPTEHGGPSCPVVSGYRPQFYYGAHDWVAQHTYIDREQVQPGDTVRAYLTFLSPQEHLGRLDVGMPFLIREGQRTVGYGRVLRIVDLEQSAHHAATASDDQQERAAT
jgi:translation elongation factor EF-Tu-like GTPase